jgi:hypothetical protein
MTGSQRKGNNTEEYELKSIDMQRERRTLERNKMGRETENKLEK